MRKMLGLIGVVVSLIGAGLSGSPTQTYTFSTLAGTAPGSVDGVGTAARFNNPWGLVADSAGNLYVTDSGNNTIRKIAPDGTVSTFAGLAGQVGLVDGAGTAARFSTPTGIAIDAHGTLYVSDRGNSRVRKITSAGVVSTVTPAFANPNGIAVDSVGNVYVAEPNTGLIKKMTPSGTVTVLAGNTSGPGEVDGTGVAVSFHTPDGLAVDQNGNVYVGDYYGCTVRKITPAGVVSTVAGLADTGGFVDGQGSAVRWGNITNLAYDGAGSLYVADGGGAVRKLALNGTATTLAGTPYGVGAADGTGSAASFASVQGIGVDAAGNVYVADGRNENIRKVTPTAVVKTLAGAPSAGTANGVGTAASFNFPWSLALDHDGNLYVGEVSDYAVRKVTPQGVVTSFATGFALYCALASAPDGSLYWCQSQGCCINRYNADGSYTTIAGSPFSSGYVDATGSAARFNRPEGLAVDATGTIYVADSGNGVVRKIAPNGAVSTLSGLKGRQFIAMTIDPAGTLYVADLNGIWKVLPSGVFVQMTQGQSPQLASDAKGNIFYTLLSYNTVNVLHPDGTVATIGGLTGVAGSLDGTGSSARFNLPYGIAVSPAGAVYVADTNNNVVRMANPPTLAFEPSPTYVNLGGALSLAAAAAEGTVNATYQWALNGQPIVSATSPRYELAAAAVSNGGSYTVTVTTPGGTVTSDPAVVTVVGLAGSPAIAQQPVPAVVATGSSAAFTFTAGTAATYQWLYSGSAIAGATESQLLVTNVGTTNVGTYTCLATQNGLSVLSSPATLAVSSSSDVGRLINASVLTTVGPGSPLTFGVVSSGSSGNEPILFRGVGPALTDFGLSGILPDPVLTVFGSNQTVLARDQGWNSPSANGTAVTAADLAVGAFTLTSPASLDAALVYILPTNQTATVQITSATGQTGTVLAEVYDATPRANSTAGSPTLSNLSCLCTLAAQQTLTAGFILGGSTARTVLIRVNGPALAGFGVQAAVPDPMLRLHGTRNGADAILGTDSAWGGTAALVTAAKTVGAFAPASLQSADSALLVTLTPGTYTVEAASASGVAGSVLVEAYQLP